MNPRPELERVRDIVRAYNEVFGKPGQRTQFQQLVLDDIERFCAWRDTAIKRDKEGRYDGGLTAYAAGLHDVIRRIHERLNWKEEPTHVRPVDSLE